MDLRSKVEEAQKTERARKRGSSGQEGKIVRMGSMLWTPVSAGILTGRVCGVQTGGEPAVVLARWSWNSWGVYLGRQWFCGSFGEGRRRLVALLVAEKRSMLDHDGWSHV